LESVFFFQKPCPSSLLFQVRLLNKKPTEAPAEGVLKTKQHENSKRKRPATAGADKPLTAYTNARNGHI